MLSRNKNAILQYTKYHIITRAVKKFITLFTKDNFAKSANHYYNELIFFC